MDAHSPNDRMPYALWCSLFSRDDKRYARKRLARYRRRRARLEHCADLLEEFLKAMTRMESEYLRATWDGHTADGSR